MATTSTFVPGTSPAASDRFLPALRQLEDLPGSFVVVQRALEVAADSGASVSKLERVLSADPATVVRVLKLANSSLFSTRQEIRNLSMAIQFIGWKTLEVLLRHILATGVLDSLSSKQPAAQRARRVASLAGVASLDVGGAAELLRPADLLNLGTLHNVGDLALCWLFPEDYAEALRCAETVPLTEAQRAIFGFDAKLAGRSLLQAWHFPKTFWRTCSHWDDPLPLPPSIDGVFGKQLCAVHLGVRLSEAKIAELPLEQVEIRADVLEELGLTKAGVDGIYGSLANPPEES